MVLEPVDNFGKTPKYFFDLRQINYHFHPPHKK